MVDRKRGSSSRASSIFSRYTRESDLFSFLPNTSSYFHLWLFMCILSLLPFLSLRNTYSSQEQIPSIDSSSRSCLRSSLKYPSPTAAPSSLCLFFLLPLAVDRIFLAIFLNSLVIHRFPVVSIYLPFNSRLYCFQIYIFFTFISTPFTFSLLRALPLL